MDPVQQEAEYLEYVEPYEPLFAQATQLIANYRKTLGLRTMFKSDLTWLATPESPAKDKAPKPSARKASIQRRIPRAAPR